MAGTCGQAQGDRMISNRKGASGTSLFFFFFFSLVWEFDSRIAENLISQSDVFQAECQPMHRLGLSRYLTSTGARVLDTCLTLPFDEDTRIKSCLKCKDRK